MSAGAGWALAGAPGIELMKTETDHNRPRTSDLDQIFKCEYVNLSLAGSPRHSWADTATQSQPRAWRGPLQRWLFAGDNRASKGS